MGILEKLFGPNRDTLMAKIARQSAMSYTKHPDQSFLEVLQDFNVFRQGRKPIVKHLFSIQEKNEISVKIFDYRFTRGHGKNRRHVWQTIVLLTSSKLSLSPFRIYPKNFFSNISAFFGNQDIEIPYDRVFNEKFIVKSAYPDQVHQHFNPSFRKLINSTLDIELEAMNYFILLNLRDLLICNPEYFDAYYHRIFEIHQTLLKSS
jgi:hypothetical protein